MTLNQVAVSGMEVLSVPLLVVKTLSGKDGFVPEKDKDEEGEEVSSPSLVMM